VAQNGYNLSEYSVRGGPPYRFRVYKNNFSYFHPYMDSGTINSQTQTSHDSQTHSNRHSEQRSPSPCKSSFNSDCLRLVGLYRRGSLTKTNAILEIFKLASHVGQSEFRGRSAAELIAPYHRMLDSFEKEIVKAGKQDLEDEEEDLEDGEGPGSNQDSAIQLDNAVSEEDSEQEDFESNSASEDDKPLHKKQRKFKLDLLNLSDPSIVRRSKKLPLSLRKTNSILMNWAHDPKHVKRKWLESASIPEFPESEFYNIIQGRVVNFDVVFSGWYSDEPEHDHEEKLGEGTKSDCGARNQSLDVRSTTLLVRQYVGSRCA